MILCDYATRYTEAVALKNISAETIAEELMTIFTREKYTQIKGQIYFIFTTRTISNASCFNIHSVAD